MDVIRRYRFIIFFSVLLTAGCSSHPKRADSEAEMPSENTVAAKNIDPWESYNRGMFKFNDVLDGAILKPLAKGYRFIAPSFVERGINNFFANINEVNGAFNNLLQWKWRKVGNNTGRLLINTTVGIVGLFDVAKHTGLHRLDPESFGQTLSYWGLSSGPYFVIPLLGPSTLTDSFSLPVDWYVSPVAHADLSDEAYYGVKALETISSRANILNAEELVSGDRYSFVRSAFMQRRNFLVNDGEVEDDFGDFESIEDDF